MREDGTDRRCLTESPFSDMIPRWSPDGKTIAFHSNRSGSVAIYAVDPDGRGLRQVTRQNVFGAVWSPDGSQMAGNLLAGGSCILDLNAPWTEQTLQPLPPIGDKEGGFIVRSWSPDGRFLAGSESTPRGVLVYSLETGAYRRLTDFGGWPRWLSDSRRLLFWHQGAIHLVDSETGEVREVLRLGSGGASPHFSLSSDDRWLYFAHTKHATDIWMLSLEREP